MANVEVLRAPQEMKNETKEEFRNYQDSEFQDRVSLFYFQQHSQQNVEYVCKMKKEFASLNKAEMSVWEAAEMLNEIVDQSDPDTDSAQIVHLLQTAEAIRKAYPGEEYDWFHLTGFLHDVGKVLAHPKLYNFPQWSVVGDTFPVGCEFDKTNVFHKFFESNPDFKNSVFSSKLGIYKENIGLNDVLFSFGHDEYMYQVCVQNKCTLPLQALYIIRYHSFYPWHTYNAYDYLCNDTDREMLKWVKEFQKFDLYSKLPNKPNVEELAPYYKSLIKKYFPEKLKW